MPAGAASKPTVSPPQSTNLLLYSGVTCWSGSSSRDAHGIGCLLCEQGVACDGATEHNTIPRCKITHARTKGSRRRRPHERGGREPAPEVGTAPPRPLGDLRPLRGAQG